ncbi:AzlD domain-containing protein [Vibrio sp. SCSIO 43136]|uniref:AzlD domain-containing protein n=1 Tax=Vibrio sp. SCSIO 43136 TaxID=2819101 RepID=UPI0020755F2D|nr:AzlD domain-containing protein [Vibrio sp. SCSIO 43136]USD66290.1 AzlD domain-containing protein [Vibrio sp. SCSIO 43136]
MSDSIWAIILLISIGTFLLRALPTWWVVRRIRKENAEGTSNEVPEWLNVLGPTMIAAMFGTSLIPVSPSALSWFATGLGVVATLLVWSKTKTLGLPVFAGVLVFGLTIYLGA